MRACYLAPSLCPLFSDIAVLYTTYFHRMYSVDISKLVKDKAKSQLCGLALCLYVCKDKSTPMQSELSAGIFGVLD